MRACGCVCVRACVQSCVRASGHVGRVRAGTYEGVGEAERLAVEVWEMVGELLGVRVMEGEDEGDGVADGCVKHVLLPGNQDAGAAHVQKVEACELFEPGPQGVQTRFGKTKPLLKLPAAQKHSCGVFAPAYEEPPLGHAVQVAALAAAKVPGAQVVHEGSTPPAQAQLLSVSCCVRAPAAPLKPAAQLIE